MVTFTIRVNNDGPDDATNVDVTDIIPTGYTNIGNINNGGALNNNVLSWSIANIAVNDSAILTFTAEVQAPSGAANEYLNTAQVSASDQE